MEVIGWQKNEFTPKGETEPVRGFNIFVIEHRRNVEGMAADRLYISEQRARECGFNPKLGDEVEVSYNRWGKVQSIEVVS